MRSVVKPAIEILAGIPTIVYGLFALITVAALGGAVAYMAPASGQADGEAAPIYPSYEAVPCPRPSCYSFVGNTGLRNMFEGLQMFGAEFWDGGSDWGLAATDITEANLLAPPNAPSLAVSPQNLPKTNSAGSHS